MSFLKKLGQVLASVVGIATGVGPIILPFLGSGQAAKVVSTGVNDLTQIGSVVVQIETALQGIAGPDKLKAALPLVGNIIKTSELVVGKRVSNETLFTQAVQEYTQATVDLLNSLHDDGVKAA